MTDEAGKVRRPILIPPVLFVLAIAAMIALHKLIPVAQWLVPPWSYLGFIPIALAAVAGLSGTFLFVRHRTTMHPLEESSKLLSAGPFRHSRNPLYASLALTLIGMALLLGSLTPLVVPPIFVWSITARFIRPEEELLERRFGEDYLAYKRRVGRWFGRR